MTKSRGILQPRKVWGKADLRLLTELWPDHTAVDIGERLGISTAIVYAKAHRLGLKKSEAFLRSSASGRMQPGDNKGAATRFKSGQIPANKGLRMPSGWAPGRMVETQFKKGRAASDAHNYLPIGSERLSKDGYLERKVTDDPSLVPARRWEFVHRIMWKQAYGPIPDGHMVEFRDGNKTHLTLENFELLSRAEHMRRHTIHRYPAEVKQAIRLVGKLKRKIREYSDEKQNS